MQHFLQLQYLFGDLADFLKLLRFYQCFFTLLILTDKNCFTQFNTRMVAWLLLTFLICLHNQLSSIHSIIIY